MSSIRARGQNGRLVPDTPTALPEGTVVNDEGDDLDEIERASINAAISKAWTSVQSRRGRPSGAVLSALRKR